MTDENPSELPVFYGQKTSDGEVVRRPSEDNALGVTSTSLRPSLRARGSSLDRMSVPPMPANPGIEEWDAATPRSIRHRPSARSQRYSYADDLKSSWERPPSKTAHSRRLLRRDDDDYDDYDYPRGYRSYERDYLRDRDLLRMREREGHPDGAYESARPPRAFRNREHPEMRRSRAFTLDSRYDRRDAYIDDDRRSYDYPSPPKTYELRQHPSTEESIDGYSYGRPKRSVTLNFNAMTKEEKAEILRLPLTQWMNSSFKNHFVATIAEFVGTTMFLFFAFAGTQVANIGSTASGDSASSSYTTSGGATGFDVSVYLYISVIFGFSLMVNVWIFFRISGGLFNPAVTLGMCLVGALPVTRAICLFCAQILGSIAASAMVLGLFPTDLNVRTTLVGDTSLAQGALLEMILTAELVFTIFMLAKEKHKATFIAPIGIGLSLFIAEMVGVYYTGGSLNPARSFGPCVVTATFDSEHWIYWIGPGAGALVAVFFYKFIKMLEYEMANPGQDGDPDNDPILNIEKRAEIKGMEPHELVQHEKQFGTGREEDVSNIPGGAMGGSTTNFQGGTYSTIHRGEPAGSLLNVQASPMPNYSRSDVPGSSTPARRSQEVLGYAA